MKPPTIFVVTILCLAQAGCRSNEPDGSKWSPAEVPAAFERAQELASAGRTAEALQLLRELRAARGLDRDLRDSIELQTEVVARRRLAELEGPDADPGELERLAEMELPGQLAAAAALAKARRHLAEGEDKQVFETIRKLGRRIPFHQGQSEAAELLFEAGNRMAADDDSFLPFLTLRNNGRQALEYLCDQFVSSPIWDRACLRVAELATEDGDWTTARQWYEDLLFMQPKSQYRILAQAMIPHLRLKAVASPEYDRHELLEARRELESWLARNAGHELTPRVRRDHRHCLQRLWASDLVVARFYRRNEKPTGARYHGERALETARHLGSEKHEAEALALLSSLSELSERKRDGEGAENAEELLDEFEPGDFASPDMTTRSTPGGRARSGTEPEIDP